VPPGSSGPLWSKEAGNFAATTLSTRVATYDGSYGKTILSCAFYSALGAKIWVSTYAPEGANCLEDGAGFRCVTPVDSLDLTVTRAPTPLVVPKYIPPANSFLYKSGTIRLQPNMGMDLENGTVGENRATDVRFNAQTTNRRFLEPVNGAKLVLVGTNEVSPEICRAFNTYTTGRISVTQLPAGTSVCVITSDRRYSAFTVSSAPATSWEAFRINFKTWRN